MVDNVQELIATDIRFSTKAKFLSVSEGAAQTILRHYLKLRRIRA
jgi:hypothetical protein